MPLAFPPPCPPCGICWNVFVLGSCALRLPGRPSSMTQSPNYQADTKPDTLIFVGLFGSRYTLVFMITITICSRCKFRGSRNVIQVLRPSSEKRLHCDWSEFDHFASFRYLVTRSFESFICNREPELRLYLCGTGYFPLKVFPMLSTILLWSSLYCYLRHCRPWNSCICCTRLT